MEKDPVKRLAEPYLHHEMIEKYIQLPEFPSQRTRLLYLFLEASGKTPKSDSTLFALVTSLMQLGLDTHARVRNETRLGLDQMREQQFKVLAGDYFSGRFYHLLARAGQIRVIRQLSASVSHVNRLKINLYRNNQQMKTDAEAYFQQTVEICSQLYLSFGEWMTEKHQNLWPKLVRNLASCELIEQEITRTKNGTVPRDSWAFWFLMESRPNEAQALMESDMKGESYPIDRIQKQHVIERLLLMLDKQLDEAKGLLDAIHPKSLSQEVHVIWSAYGRESFIDPSTEEVLR